jgi:hypothetical protein
MEKKFKKNKRILKNIAGIDYPGNIIKENKYEK